MTTRRSIAFLFTLSVFAPALSAQPARKIKQPKDERDPVTQKLEIPPEPPMAASAETAKLIFHVSPLSAKGLLSQQIRDALKALDRANGGATIVKLRAFVSGGGDLRRVAAIVSEEFSARKLPIPVVSTIQVGALPLEGAQVVIESIGADKKIVNPAGLAFFSGQRIAQLRAAGVSMLRVTCFLSSLDDVPAVRASVTAAFPTAAADFVQLTRLASQPLTVCEGVGRLDTLQVAKPNGQDVPGVVMVSRPKLVFTGLQLAFSAQDSDIRLAFEHIRKALESQGASSGDVVFTNTYSLNRSVAAKAGAGPPGTAQVFEGLPSLDATMAVEVVAAKD